MCIAFAYRARADAARRIALALPTSTPMVAGLAAATAPAIGVSLVPYRHQHLAVSSTVWLTTAAGCTERTVHRSSGARPCLVNTT